MTQLDSSEMDKVDEVENFFDEMSSIFDKHQDTILRLINEAKTVRATLIVNFGREHGKKIAGLEIDETLPTHKMLIVVLEAMLAKIQGR